MNSDERGLDEKVDDEKGIRWGSKEADGGEGLWTINLLSIREWSS